MSTTILLVTLIFHCAVIQGAVLRCLIHPTLDEKLSRNADFNDHNGDGVITSSDIAYDLNNNYDSNHDHKVSEAEWLRRWPCAFGDSSQFATFAFNQISQGEPFLQASQFTGEPFRSGVPRQQFIDLNRGRYEQFESLGCLNHDVNIEGRLDLNAADNDHDNNGRVTYSDIAYDINHRYDTNHDGHVTKFEWVTRWTCAYGDNGDYARYVWDQIAQGANSIRASQFNREPFTSGIPIEAFRANNQQRYDTYLAEKYGSIIGK